MAAFSYYTVAQWAVWEQSPDGHSSGLAFVEVTGFPSMETSVQFKEVQREGMGGDRLFLGGVSSVRAGADSPGY